MENNQLKLDENKNELSNDETELLKAMQQQSDYTPPETTEETETTESTEPETKTRKEEQSEDLNDLNEAFVSMLDPAVIITMFDGVMVMLSSFIFKAMNVECDKSVMALTTTEKSALRPSVKEFLKTLNLNLSPTTALLLSVGLIYGSKISVVVTEAKFKGGKATALTDTPTRPKTGRTGLKRGSYKKKLKIQTN
jgi:hypothetical protein